ncbi:MAG: DUF2061 domain-containing protein [Candidatus Paceibacterota bacterium]|jgi:uncharacterized membrane protein
MDTKSRSALKAITWRILATLITGTVVFIYTGKIVESSVITLTVAIISTLAYYLHERFWAWIKK